MHPPNLFAIAALGLRLGLFAAGVPLPGFTFGFILMGIVTLLAFLSGWLLLREEPNAPMPSLFRVALRDTAIFALLCAAGLYLFNQYLNNAEFEAHVNGIIQASVAQGVPEADARAKAQAFFTPGSQAFLTFVGLLALGAFNALFFAIVQHKVLRRYR